jgi:hypothetical protein
LRQTSGATRIAETRKGGTVTLFWFVIWFIWNLVGDNEPLVANPVNFWLGTLILAVALDLGGHHAACGRRR